MEENKYEPLNQQEYIDLRTFTSSLGGYLQENQLNYVWGMFNRLTKANEPQPCSCKSASAHWKRAVDYLTDWINKRR